MTTRYKIGKESGTVVHLHGNPHGEDCDTDILEGMSRALWVCAYADWFEGLSKAERREAGGPVSLQGVDWSEDAPPAPPEVETAARWLCRLIERANEGRSVTSLYGSAKNADMLWGGKGGWHSGGPEGDARDTFGHYLAMMSLGHGVSWFDDHAKFPLKTPSFETMYDGSSFEWSPRDRSNR